jgi:hypothetical protein
VAAFALYWHGLALAALLAAASAWIYLSAPRTSTPIFDDSYISATFARNLAESGKLSFDGDTWSTGATSPLHILVMTAFVLAGTDPIDAGLIVGAVAHVFLAAGVYLLALTIFRSRGAALLAAAAIAFNGYTALDAGNGLETSMFLALIALVGASLFALKGPAGSLCTGGLIAAAVLTRPEGAFLLPAAVAYRWIDRGKDEKLSSYLLDAVLIGLPGTLALAANAAYSYAVVESLGGTASAKLQFFRENESPFMDKVVLGGDNAGLFLAALLPLVAIGSLVLGRRQTAFPVLFLAPIFVVYVLLFPGGLLHYYYRYQHPVLPFVAAFAGGGAWYLLSLAARRDFVVKALVVLGLSVAIVPLWQQYARWRNVYEAASNEAHDLLVGMVVDLNSRVLPGEAVATHDIGVVGYYGRFGVVDLVGLVNPNVITYHDDRQLERYLDETRPEYLLMFAEWDIYFLRLFPQNNPDKYELIKVYPAGTQRLLPYSLYRIRYRLLEP